MTSKFINWLEGVKCPRCGEKKLLAGPAWDRGRLRCLNCSGKPMRMKKELVDAHS